MADAYTVPSEATAIELISLSPELSRTSAVPSESIL
jgi:hypothetical protein